MRRRDFIAGGLLAGLTAGAARAAEVVVTDVREQGLVGKFYALPGARRRTAVMMVGGSDGGLPSSTACRSLAEAGHPVLALAYFRGFNPGLPQSLPAQLKDIPLEYFFTAIDWLKARPEVNPRKVVLMGHSRGGELVLQLASMRRDVAGVIAFTPSHLRWGAVGGEGDSWTWRGKPLPYARDKWEQGKSFVQAFNEVLDAPRETWAAAAIEVEKIRGKVLLFSTTADGVWPSTRLSELAMERMREKGKRGARDHVRYDDASHMLMGPGPGMIRFQAAQFTIEFGGSEDGTLKARNDAWAKSLEFLKRI